MAGSTFLIAACLLVPAFLAGRSYQSARDRRRFSLALDEALSQVSTSLSRTRKEFDIQGIQRLSAVDHQHYEILRLCESGAWSRALTMIQGVDVLNGSRGLHELYVHLLLKFGHLEAVCGTIDALQRRGGAPRLIFGALIACGRWVDAVSFYRAELQSQQGSRKEAQLLELWTALFETRAESEVELVSAGASEVRRQLSVFLSNHSACDSTEAPPKGAIKKGFALGIRCPAEMHAWLTFEKKYTLCESQAQRVHLIDSTRIRGDWTGLALGLLKVGLSAQKYAPILLGSAQVLAKPHLDCERIYRCQHCEVMYGPFSVICPSCFTVSLGEPVRGESRECDAQLFSACGLDLDGLEALYWELILPLS
jgi:hypothetical protein